MSSDPTPLVPLKTSHWDQYKRQLFLAVGVTTFILLLLIFMALTRNILLLLFLCVLGAVGLRASAHWLAERTPLSDKIALAVVALTVLVAGIATGILVGNRLAGQFSQLQTTLTASLQQVEDQLSQYEWGKQLLAQIPSASQVEGQIFGTDTDIFARITGVVSSTLSLASSFLIVVFLCLYLAIEPKTYVTSFLHLVPMEKRSRVHHTLRQVADTLRKWLITRLISMVIVGILTAVGLTILGVPLTLSLTLLAGLGSFIPTFGPILALIPAALVAFTQSPQTVFIVILLYTGVQLVDNYLVTPIVQKSMLYLPPAYIVATQLIFGVIAGPFGLILAAPLSAALVVVVRLLYVEDVLGDRLEVSQSP